MRKFLFVLISILSILYPIYSQTQNLGVTASSYSSQSSVRVAQLEITGAQLAAINTTPVTGIVPHPGAGKAIVQIAVAATWFSIQFKPGTIPYSKFGQLDVNMTYGNSGIELASTHGLEGPLGSNQFLPQGYFDAGFPDDIPGSFDDAEIVFRGLATSTGRITASNVAAGQAGLLYAPGDTFTVNTGDGLAAGVVDTAGGGGNVLTYHLTAQGTTYPVSAGVATTTTSGAGSGLKLDITAIQSVADGDGPIWITIPYIVVDLH